MDFIRGQNTPYCTFLETLISKYDFGGVKLQGRTRNGPQDHSQEEKKLMSELMSNG